ncbi:MAG: NTP transferase domain-containing protein, partial [Chloroflexota bacterium]
PDGGGIVENMLRGVDALEATAPVLICSVDIPLVTAEAVRDLVARCEAAGAELCYTAVRRDVMEAAFPGSGRSYRPLVEGDLCGGDINWVAPQVIQRNIAFARELTARRKSAWALARLMGPGILARLLVRRLRLRDLERRGGKLLGCTCQAILSPYAELAMDVDKPHHLAVVLRAMERSRGGATAG